MVERIRKCPICNVEMKKIERHEVILDRCPNCLGLWFDKGELDKLVEFRKAQHKEYEKKTYEKPRPGNIPPGHFDDIDVLFGVWG